MNYWIFTAAPYRSDTESYPAKEIYQRRMQDRFWGLGARTGNRKNLRRGDQVVFYIARPESAFAGTARLASDSFSLSAEEKEKLSHGSPFFSPEYGVWLEAIEVWESSHPVATIAPNLKFIKDAAQWWTYLQGGVRQIEETDYAAIASGFPSGDASARVAQDLSSQSRFALEAHLEDFIDRNWPNIWGETLELYRDGEQTGRQYPAGTWSIDFLSVDRNTKEFVVIELKRGQTSDATVGQVLRYISWVRENLAAPNQNVRGIIVASEVDQALRYAAREIGNVSVQTYEVTFTLQTAEL